MIRQIFKIIWNERKVNLWILCELTLAFIILWFCFDFLYYTANRYFEPRGFDIEHVYRVNIGQNKQKTKVKDIEIAATIVDRIKHYPGVEAISLSKSSMPYSASSTTSGYSITEDSIMFDARKKAISSDFFDVFRIDLLRGNIFDWRDPAVKSDAIVSVNARNEVDGTPMNLIANIHEFDKEDPLKVVGIAANIKDNDFEPYSYSVFTPLVNSYMSEICVRISPEADHDFINMFTKEMRSQLNIENRYLQNVEPLSDYRKIANEAQINKLNGVFAVTLFIVVNIFLGIIGTFWFRTQSRRKEIGLRMALGSSRIKVECMVFAETLIMLFIASIIATIVALNIGQTDVLSNFGIPNIDRERAGIGIEQDAINYLITFLFLGTISCLAVWYPARQAAKTQPATVLHEE